MAYDVAQNHLRDKFLAGALAAVPVAVVVWGALLVEMLHGAQLHRDIQSQS